MRTSILHGRRLAAVAYSTDGAASLKDTQSALRLPVASIGIVTDPGTHFNRVVDSLHLVADGSLIANNEL